MRYFLIIGQTGVGKSSFINATFGIQLAKTSDFEPCTKSVKYYAYGTSYGDICLIDTPGLGEDNTYLDLSYLQTIRNSTDFQQLYATLYLTPLNETRFRPVEKKTLSLLTQELGAKTWSRVWLVFTFAASVVPERRKIACLKRWEQIALYLKEITTSDTFFEKILLVDNIVSNWAEDSVPIASVLTK